jgi:hypothetical protein
LDLKRENVKIRWQNLHNEELHNSYVSPNIIRVIESVRMRWAVGVARIREMKNAYNTLVVKHNGKRPLGRHRRSWEDNIRKDLKETVWEM